MQLHEERERVDVERSLSAGRLVRDIGAWSDDIALPIALLVGPVAAIVFTILGESPKDAAAPREGFLIFLSGTLLICSSWIIAAVRQLRIRPVDTARFPVDIEVAGAACAELQWTVFETRKNLLRAVCPGDFGDKILVVIAGSGTLFVNVRNRSTGRGVRVPLHFGGLRRIQLQFEAMLVSQRSLPTRPLRRT
jgi:hypothetical protein